MKLNATHALLSLVLVALLLNAGIALRPPPALAAEADLSTLSRQLSGLASGMEQILAKLGQIESGNRDLAHALRNAATSGGGGSSSSQGGGADLGSVTASLNGATRSLDATNRSLAPLNRGLESIYWCVEPLNRNLSSIDRNLNAVNRNLERIAEADVLRLRTVRMGDDAWAFPVVPCQPAE